MKRLLQSNKELRLLLTQKCNYDCVFCNHEQLNTKVENNLTVDDYVYLFTVCKNKLGWQNISLTGGEPLIYKEFDTLVRSLAQEKAKITVISNGELLDKHFDTVKLLERINLSLHSINPENYHRLIQREDKLRHVLTNIKTIRKDIPEVDIRLNIVLSRGINDHINEIKKLIDFANSADCSIKFIELANDKDKMISLDEIEILLNSLGIKELPNQVNRNKRRDMTNNIILTRTTCEYARLTDDPAKSCNKDLNLFVAPNGQINQCTINDKSESILGAIKHRDDEVLIHKLSKINEGIAKTCVFKKDDFDMLK